MSKLEEFLAEARKELPVGFNFFGFDGQHSILIYVSMDSPLPTFEFPRTVDNDGGVIGYPKMRVVYVMAPPNSPDRRFSRWHAMVFVADRLLTQEEVTTKVRAAVKELSEEISLGVTG